MLSKYLHPSTPNTIQTSRADARKTSTLTVAAVDDDSAPANRLLWNSVGDIMSLDASNSDVYRV